MSDKKHKFYNTTDGPITMTDEGHILGGFESGDYDPNTSQVMRAKERGDLIDKGPVEQEDEPDALNGHKVSGSDHSLTTDGDESKDASEPDKSIKSANKGRTSGKVK